MQKETLHAIKPGDTIERMLAFCISQHLIVTDVKDNIIYAGHWTFDRDTGLEIDDAISMTISYIRKVVNTSV